MLLGQVHMALLSAERLLFYDDKWQPDSDLQAKSARAYMHTRAHTRLYACRDEHRQHAHARSPSPHVQERTVAKCFVLGEAGDVMAQTLLTPGHMQVNARLTCRHW